MLLCGRSTVRPGSPCEAFGEAASPARGRRRGGRRGARARAAPPRRRRRPGACRRRPSCASGARAAINAREPTSAEPTGAPSPFEKQTETVSNGAAIARAVARGSPPSATAALKRRAPSRWVDRPRFFASAHAACEVRDRQRLAADRVLEAEQPALRVVRIVGLDRRLDRRQRQRAVGLRARAAAAGRCRAPPRRRLPSGRCAPSGRRCTRRRGRSGS